MGKLDGKKVAIVANDGFEESELLSPRAALESEGAQVRVLSTRQTRIRGWTDKDWSRSVEVYGDVSKEHAADYDALMLPGGVINADALRVNPDAVRFATEFFGANKPIAAICHAPWLLIETGRLTGRRLTSYRTLKTDLENAGAEWVDEEVAQDENLLTSRAPPDLPAFNARLVELVASWKPSLEVEGDEALAANIMRREDGDGAAMAANDDRPTVEPSTSPLPKAELSAPTKKKKKDVERRPPPAGRGTSTAFSARRPPQTKTPSRGR